MKRISGLLELQQLTMGDSKIKIAVLDGPVDLKHSCFKMLNNNLISVKKQTIQSSSGLALQHGTAVASLIFGQPNSIVEGVAPGCSGLFIPIYSDDDNGKFYSATQVELARAIKTAIEHKVHIINISGGQLSSSGEPEYFLQQAIDECKRAGILIVAAAGNDGCSCLHVPAADHQVLAVGSMDEKGQPTPQTNFGTSYLSNGILAPGKNLTAAMPGGATFQTNGATSYATPIISGIVGLLMSWQLKMGLHPDAYAVKSLLEATATPCPFDENSGKCDRFLRGRLNLPAVLQAIQKDSAELAVGLKFSHKNKIIIMEKFANTSIEPAVLTPKASTMVLPSENPPTAEDTLPEMVPESSFTTEQETVPTVKKEPASELQGQIVPACVCEDEKEEADSTKPIPSAIQASSTQTIPSSVISTNQSKINTMENQNFNFISTPSATPTAVLTPSGMIDPSDCGCGGAKKTALVYALGTIGYDFGSESHRDSFHQSMNPVGTSGRDPNNPADLLAFLDNNPEASEEIIWTLNIDSTPIYSLVPHGAFGVTDYNLIRQFFKDQIAGNIQRISVPGISAGSRTLLNGQKVALLVPRARGMFSWTTAALGASVTSSGVLPDTIINFLDRVYFQMRNLGLSGAERALNYSATDAFQVSQIFAKALQDGLVLDTISTAKSPICRPGAECYDVIITFFNPDERLTQARKQFRTTVDVSDVVPVTVDRFKSWFVF